MGCCWIEQKKKPCPQCGKVGQWNVGASDYKKGIRRRQIKCSSNPRKNYVGCGYIIQEVKTDETFEVNGKKYNQTDVKLQLWSKSQGIGRNGFNLLSHHGIDHEIPHYVWKENEELLYGASQTITDKILRKNQLKTLRNQKNGQVIVGCKDFGWIHVRNSKQGQFNLIDWRTGLIIMSISVVRGKKYKNTKSENGRIIQLSEEEAANKMETFALDVALGLLKEI